METINCLRVELAEELETLPASLQSMFPDLGTDFLYSVFHDVMEKSLACGEHKGGVSCSGRNCRVGHLERGISTCDIPQNDENGSPVAKRTRSCQNIKSEEESEEEKEEGHHVAMLEEALEELHDIHEKLNRMDANSIQYPRCYSERILSDRDGNGAQTVDNVSLVRCVVCSKTIDESGIESHVKHCKGRQIEEVKQEQKQNVETESIEVGTSSLGCKAQSGGESVEMGKASQSSKTKKVKHTLSNIAPIITSHSEDYSGLPLSPVLKAASGARQGRSSGVRRRRSDPLPSPTPSGVARTSPGYTQGPNMNFSPGFLHANGIPYQNHSSFGLQNTFMGQCMPPTAMPQQRMMMPHQDVPMYQGERLLLNPEQKQFLESQQLRNHIQFLQQQQQQNMYLMGQGRPAMHAPQNTQQYHMPAMGHPHVVLGRAMNEGQRMQPTPHQIYQNILSMQQHANRLGPQQYPDLNSRDVPKK